MYCLIMVHFFDISRISELMVPISSLYIRTVQVHCLIKVCQEMLRNTFLDICDSVFAFL